MLSVLKELREKSEFIPTESEKESENAEEHNEEANPIAEDDFFMEEWVVCSFKFVFSFKEELKKEKAVWDQFINSYKLFHSFKPLILFHSHITLFNNYSSLNHSIWVVCMVKGKYW